MSAYEEILEQAAKDGSIEPTEWSRTFEAILARLEQNVHTEFLIPTVAKSPTPSTIREPPVTPLKKQPSDPGSSDSQPSQATNKENALPSSPPTSASQPSTALPTANNTAASAQNTEGVLPEPLLVTWNYVRTLLTKQFSSYPPHTVQRLSELALRPRQHYRFLPAYLNALDRVVSVSSGSNAFPLPAVDLGAGSGSLLNGTGSLLSGASRSASSTSSSLGLDSDESFGGALLSPIPWLRNSPAGSTPSSPGLQANGNIDGSDAGLRSDSSSAPGDGDTAADGIHGPGSRSSGAVTQGELLRQEQEASDPPAPVASAESRQHTVAVHHAADGASAEGDGEVGVPDNQEEEQPHARGPELIGMEDTGPQDQHPVGQGQVLDMEAAVGRSSSTNTASVADKATVEPTSEAPPDEDEEMSDAKKDSDGDIEITDVDGVPDGETRGDDTAPDAVDTTAR